MNTEETLIKVTVPLFLLSGMDRNGDNYSAKVLSHEGTELMLEVGGTSVTAKVENQKMHFKTNTVLVFNADGALVSTTGDGDVYKKAKTVRSETSNAPRQTGSTERRENKLF